MPDYGDVVWRSATEVRHAAVDLLGLSLMNSTRMQQSFDDFFQAFQERTGMYVQPVSYDTAVAFLTGYSVAATDDPLESFQEWINAKMGQHCSLHWSAIVREQFSGGTDADALKTLFEFIKEFRREARSPSGN